MKLIDRVWNQCGMDLLGTWEANKMDCQTEVIVPSFTVCSLETVLFATSDPPPHSPCLVTWQGRRYCSLVSIPAASILVQDAKFSEMPVAALVR